MEIVILVIFTIFLTIFQPFLCFLGGWIAGWLIKITIGEAILSGLSLLHFSMPSSKLPLFFGTIAVIGSFFRSTHITRKES